MQHEQLLDEARILLDMVERRSTSLTDSVMKLDAAGYADPGLFQRERTELFRNHAQFVGPSCMLPQPGDFYAFGDTGIPILVVRREDRSLAAFVNICSHRGAPLGEGCGQARKNRLLSCPYHGWSYDLEGNLVGLPFGKEGFNELDRATLGLRRLDVQEKDGLIFVMPNPELRFDINEVLGGIGATMSGFGFDRHHLFGIKRVETAINWKLNMDTFHEFYHFDALHPDTIATMSYNNICHYRQYGRNHSLSSPRIGIEALRGQDERDWNIRDNVSFVNYLFPNTVIFVVGDHFQTWRVYPIDQRRSVVYHSMFVPELPQTAEAREQMEAFFQMINDVAVREDYSLVERMQVAVDSGIERHVHIGRNEPGVQNMHRQISEVLAPAQVVRLQR
jgi:phenylpropionate dioxygenase-like ring-hydroxylating dioxygenase large terminal subunit